MAQLEKRGDWYWIDFRFGGKRYRKTLKTKDPSVAENVLGGARRTLMLLGQEALHIPDGADVASFILSGGRTVRPHGKNGSPATAVTLEELRDQYIKTLSIGAVEKSSLVVMTHQLRRILKVIGPQLPVERLTMNALQGYVNVRAKDKGRKGRCISPLTLQAEIACLRAAWNWGRHAGLVKERFPNWGLKFPKSDEKPPFQTWAEIERRIAEGGLKEAQIADMWDCLYLREDEIAELLSYVKQHGTARWLYPLVATAAYTGARRSELLRIETADVDFIGNSIVIHEKKRSRAMRTHRRVPITPFLKLVLEEWLRARPGGPWLFANCDTVKSKTKRSVTTQIDEQQCSDHFKRTLRKGKWRVVRGLHMLRHSYVSCLASRGTDQRFIDAFVGHQSEAQQKRYRHLAPDVKRDAVMKVFGS